MWSGCNTPPLFLQITHVQLSLLKTASRHNLKSKLSLSRLFIGDIPPRQFGEFTPLFLTLICSLSFKLRFLPLHHAPGVLPFLFAASLILIFVSSEGFLPVSLQRYEQNLAVFSLASFT